MGKIGVMVNLLRIYPKKLASVLAGRIAFMSLPKIIRVSLLRLFARHYGVNLDEAEKPLEDYKSLQEFFTRRLKPGARPQDEIVPGAINCPVDGRLVALGRISDGTLIQAKGLSYSLKDLLKFTPGPERFEGGHFLTLYLSPKDYHRIHVPLEGVVQAVARVEGELWPVNDASVTRVPRLYERNRRATWLAQGRGLDEGLLVACVLVGATHVGGCVIDERWLGGRDLTRNGGFEVSDLQCAQGDDLGLFQFGSTVVLLVGGLRANSWQPIAAEGLVKVGQRLGEFR